MNLLDEMCRHCNNYFTPGNDPDELFRDYPPAFTELAGRIKLFIDAIGERNNITASRVGSGSENVDLEYASWQKAFARDLAIWKRARFI